jgi:transposase
MVVLADVTVLRDEVEPGSEAQIGYGFLGQWTDPRTGRRHRVWAFVRVLPCSRHMFVRPVLHLDQQAWTEAHVAAFRYFGGVPRRLVPDNLKTGSTRRRPAGTVPCTGSTRRNPRLPNRPADLDW